ncbi:cutinase [Colletotrichum lupini]|uniref:Cutinase n=1 Tax=Colletotrichum lupini TaxID=145971 RepID=A0A9Q8SLG3_9PEZI|nr:cutinase [Colletotrichum lupini]UQC79542.1 cutinase [Colletotrichum lupini]
MRVKTSTALTGILAATAATAQNATSTCATGVYIIVARGSNEAPGSGRIGSVANGTFAAIPGSQIAPLDYPATFDNYSTSVAAGAVALNAALTSYNARCPNSKVALLGYSQVSSRLIAVILFGDPTHNVSASWNKGTSKRNGLFPRENVTKCEAYASKIESYCDTGDIYCDLGNNTAVHGSYFANYTDDAVEFIWAQYNASKSSNGSSPTATPTTVPGSGAADSAPGLLMSLAGLSMLAAFIL